MDYSTRVSILDFIQEFFSDSYYTSLRMRKVSPNFYIGLYPLASWDPRCFGMINFNVRSKGIYVNYEGPRTNRTYISGPLITSNDLGVIKEQLLPFLKEVKDNISVGYYFKNPLGS